MGCERQSGDGDPFSGNPCSGDLVGFPLGDDDDAMRVAVNMTAMTITLTAEATSPDSGMANVPSTGLSRRGSRNAAMRPRRVSESLSCYTDAVVAAVTSAMAAAVLEAPATAPSSLASHSVKRGSGNGVRAESGRRSTVERSPATPGDHKPAR